MTGPVLITYADRLAGSLGGVADLLGGPLAGVFRGVHVLPFFTPVHGADAGFDPDDQRVVDPVVGSWDDVRRLADVAEPWADLIVNHVSDTSPWFRDVAERGDASPYAGMFHTFDGVFPQGATETDLLRIFRPRPGLPFTTKQVGGRARLMWTTFTEHQIDLDLEHPAGRAYLREVMTLMASYGVRYLRLDAAGYVAKRPGTSCFLIDPTYELVRRLTEEARGLGLTVLAEVHAHHRYQAAFAEVVDLVYDFALPPLLLHAVHSGGVEPLLAWLQVRPPNTVTVLDTHDGIGVMDVGADPLEPRQPEPGLLSPPQIDRLVEAIHTASGGVSRRATGAAASNLDLYQVNCTWYDAVGRDDARHLLTRLVQLMLPGVPQVYYVGLLAGSGDEQLLARTGVGRDVNRHHYRADELTAQLARPVVAATIAALRLRGGHPAFGGAFAAGPGDTPGSLWLEWTRGDDRVRLDATPGQGTFRWEVAGDAGVRTARTVGEVAALT